MMRQLGLLLLSVGLAAGQKLRNVAVTMTDTNGTAPAAGETLGGLDIAFTCVTDGATQADITIPSGLMSGSGNLSISGSARRLGEDSDYEFYESESDFERRLSSTCRVTGAYVSGTTLTLYLDNGAGGSCAAGSSVSTALTPSGSVTYGPVPSGTINFAVVTNVDNDPVAVAITQAGDGTYSVSVVGDPITWYNGKKIKFWFPNYKLLPLLKTPELTVWASTFEGPNQDYQWFERFVITGTKDETIVDVKVRHMHPEMNRSHFNRGDFRQLDIRIEGTQRLRRLAQQMFQSADGKVQVGVGARVYQPPRVHFSPLVEFVMVETESISFLIHASHAGAEFPNDMAKQVRYTHLDWVNLEMVGEKRFLGILPQLWGTVPRTPEIEEMLVAPSKRQALCGEAAIGRVSESTCTLASS